MRANNVEHILRDLRITAQAAGLSKSETVGGADFAQMLGTTLQRVSSVQNQAQLMAQEFSSGASGENIQDVMINLQKASLAFQQVVQVRNRLVSAYHEIMSMQV